MRHGYSHYSVASTGGGGSTDHASLSNLTWTVSGHIGTADRIAGFDGLGAARYYQIGVDIQAWSTELQGLSTLAVDGLVTRTASGVYAARTITGTSGRISISNGSGVAGNPTIDVGSDVITTSTVLGGDLTGSLPNPSVSNLTIAGEVQGSVLYFNGTSWVQLAPGVSGTLLQSNGAGTNPSWVAAPVVITDHAALSNLSWTVSGHTGTASRVAGFDGTGAASFYQIGVDLQAWSTELQGLSTLASTGLVTRTAAGTYATRTIQGTAGRVSITDGSGVGGDPTIDVDSSILPRAGTAQVDFGVSGDVVSVDVPATWVTSSTIVTVSVAAISTTGHDPEDAVVENLSAYAGVVTAGVGFKLWAVAPNGASGIYQLNYMTLG